MVRSTGSSTERLIIAEPNRSASWRTNQLLLWVVALWCLTVGGAFAAAGLWLILPFAGAELAALWGSLYWLCWKLNERHVLRFDARQVIIEQGIYHPRRVWRLAREQVSISVDLLNHPEDPLQISLCSPQGSIPIARFLNLEDSRRLLGLLRAEGLPVRNYSHAGHLKL